MIDFSFKTSISTNYHYLPEETQKELKVIAETLAIRGKGLLAVDESNATMARRFKDIHVENTEEIRRQYRKMLFSTENLGNFISGAILFHETLFQKAEEDGSLLIDLLLQQQIIPGIKVDKGVVPIYGTENECTTQGLDDLGPRCEQYKKNGCHFAKWRSVFKIGTQPQTPSDLAIQDNANVIARYASICQAYRLVPIVEPEVLPDGNHSILRCQKATEKVLAAVFKSLNDYNVFMEGLILKINMVTPGQAYKIKASPEEIAEATLFTLQRTVPASVAGVMFLSGGQKEEEATVNLNAINKIGVVKPWKLSFSYGRALQASALHAWKGNPNNVLSAQQELIKRAKANAEASLGLYETQDYEPEGVQNETLFISDNEY